MKSILFAVLTTLFVSAMPLQAAYATADDAQSKEACESISYQDALPASTIEAIKTNNGTLTELEGVRASAFLSRLEDLAGSKAPYVVNRIILVLPVPEAETYNVAIFSNDCLKTVLQLPVAVVETLLSPLEKKPGERVD